MFKVEKVPLYAKYDGYDFPDAYGIYRTDTKACLGVVGGQYIPVQNEELHDIIREAAEVAGLTSDNVLFKELQGGKKVAFQVKLPDWVINEEDKVVRWASALNSHDGSSSLGIGLVGFRLACSNTWVTAYKGLTKVRHSWSISSKVKEMANSLIEGIERDKHDYEVAMRLFNTAYNEIDHTKFIKELIGFDLKDLQIRKMRANEEGNKLYTTKSENKFNLLSDSIDIELGSAGNNLWGLFNGVTRFTNHVEAIRKKDPDAYLYFGGGKVLTDRALEILS